MVRIHPPVQGIQVQSQIREDPTCHRAAQPTSHDYGAYALEPVSHNYGAHRPQLLKLAHLEPVFCCERSHHNEQPEHCNEE